MRRRLIIIGIIAAVIALALGVFYFAAIHVPPSCTDRKQDQGEEGVDCGGPCAYLCTASEAPPSARFARALSPVPGRIDVIAYIDNPNADAAAKALPYTIELYDSSNAIVAKKEGTVDLPPAATVPVFVPAIASGSASSTRAFITFDAPAHLWYRSTGDRLVPQVGDALLALGDAPRITAEATNPGTATLQDVAFVATIFDASGNAIAASHTVVPAIAPRATVPLVFTWPSAFGGAVSRIEILPVASLP